MTTKRSIDLLLTILFGPFLIVVFFAVAIAVRVSIGSPILFSQIRPGKDGKPFKMYKFRTMTDERNTDGSLKDDVDRLSRFGRLLRSTSLDELPEFYNVLKGDMSIVGPRPLLVEYLPLYSTEQARRHEIKPGITGWAQVNGRNAISWEAKFNLDVWYVDHYCWLLDLKILGLTVKKIFARDGISAADHVTMEKFQGDQN